MVANPFLGVLYHWIGGLAAASFYIPYRGIRRWSWETYWIVGGVFSWVVAPWLVAAILVPDLWGVLRATSGRTLFWTISFGWLRGVGWLTFGLTMRYLGIALGMAVALGFTMLFGTLVPPIFSGVIGEIVRSAAGQVILAGVTTCAAGIAITGTAGAYKEREVQPDVQASAVPEFDFRKGLLMATFSGVMSACFAYGLAAGKPVADVARQHLTNAGRSDLWQNLPVLILILAGGFSANFVWCLVLNVRNRTYDQYVRSPLLANYALCAIAGLTWYLQFFFYGMGETRMGPYSFSSWTMHMASIIIFSTLWGIGLGEWAGISRRTGFLVGLGLLLLVGSTILVGYGNFLRVTAAG